MTNKFAKLGREIAMGLKELKSDYALRNIMAELSSLDEEADEDDFGLVLESFEEWLENHR